MSISFMTFCLHHQKLNEFLLSNQMKHMKIHNDSLFKFIKMKTNS